MTAFRFIHTADLHLDASFKGISKDASHLRQALQNATFAALNKLVQNAIASNVRFVVIAGDIYNHEDKSLKAQLALRDAAVTLGKHGISLFLAHGNHDPATSRSQAVNWPDNVILFGTDTVEQYAVYEQGVKPLFNSPSQKTLPQDIPLGGAETTPTASSAHPDKAATSHNYKDNSQDTTGIIPNAHGKSPSEGNAHSAVSGELLAIVQGISHGTKSERRNLAKRFSRTEHNVFQVAVLHCSVDTIAASDQYAPCSLNDLVNAGPDYWALGHVHERSILHTSPHVVYPGNPQGLHINETGPRGCELVSVTERTAECTFIPLADVQLEQRTVDISGVSTLDELESRITDILDTPDTPPSKGDTADHAKQNISGTVVRLILSGRGTLDTELRRDNATEDLLERLREAYAGQSPFLWLKDIRLATRPEADLERLRQREDLLGETIRSAEELKQIPPDTLRSDILKELFQHKRMRKVLEDVPDTELAEIAAQADIFCIDTLEAE